MLQNISWGEYGLFIMITLVIYYTSILGIYYRHGIKTILSGSPGSLFKSNNKSHQLSQDKSQMAKADHDETSENDLTSKAIPLILTNFLLKLNPQLSMRWTTDSIIRKSFFIYKLSRRNTRL